MSRARHLSAPPTARKRPGVIVIVAAAWVGFPNGAASTSRVTAYARGLAASGQDVRLILLGPSELDEDHALNTEIRGIHQGIPFEYTSVSTAKDPRLLVRRWRSISTLFKARRRIRELDAQHGVDAILLYSVWMSTAAFFERVSRSIAATYIVDLCEVPYHFMAPGAARDKKQERFGRRFMGRFDLVVAISRYLAGYAARHVRPSAEVIVLPIMVDCDEYRSDEQPARSPRIVTYVGTLNERKDGVATLMMAFAHVAAEFSDVNLRLVGDAHDARTSNIPEFLAVAEGLGIAGRVEFTGQVPHSQVARHLRESSLLVLARPSSQQADAGFPTKLGEYLASGRPTIVTRTSDIEEYLSDGVDAYLVPPGDVDALEGALRRALADPDGAAAVGAAGRLVAEERFDYRSSGRVLAETVSRLRGARR